MLEQVSIERTLSQTRTKLITTGGAVHQLISDGDLLGRTNLDFFLRTAVVVHGDLSVLSRCFLAVR